jgi:hypothetical protein
MTMPTEPTRSTESAPPAAADFERRIRALRLLATGAVAVSCGAVIIAIVAVTRAPGAGAGAPASKLEELTVQRINVVEPDGTPRMIIASRARFPGAFSQHKEIARPDRRDLAGILFVDDEGTENGGLVQMGLLDGGKVSAALSMTFDRFRQDQMLQLFLDEDGDKANAGVRFYDRPSYKVFSIDDLLKMADEAGKLPPDQREAVMKRHGEAGHFGHQRGYLGTRDGAARLALNDPQGRPRLVLAVSPQGEPSIELLDEAGKSVRTIDLHTP